MRLKMDWRIKLVDGVSNKEVLKRMKVERTLTLKRRKGNWIGHIIKRTGILRTVLEWYMYPGYSKLRLRLWNVTNSTIRVVSLRYSVKLHGPVDSRTSTFYSYTFSQLKCILHKRMFYFFFERKCQYWFLVHAAKHKEYEMLDINN